MKINVLEDKKRVEVWVENKEKDNPFTRASLEALFRKYSAKNFLVAVFYSGGKDLLKNTEALILHNRLCAAK